MQLVILDPDIAYIQSTGSESYRLSQLREKGPMPYTLPLLAIQCSSFNPSHLKLHQIPPLGCYDGCLAVRSTLFVRMFPSTNAVLLLVMLLVSEKKDRRTASQVGWRS